MTDKFFFFGRRLKMIFSFVTKELEISFLWLCILKRNACSLLNTSYNVVTKQFILKSCIRYNFLNRSIENRDPLHRRSARRKTNSISGIAIQKFLINRSISLKKNWIQLQVKKKKTWKKVYMESKTVMLINSVLMTTLILLYVKI